MEQSGADWSVVSGKRDKKTSPKAQKKKSLKRGEPPLQRSTSNGQISQSTRRRKTGPHDGISGITVPVGVITRNAASKLITFSNTSASTEGGGVLPVEGKAADEQEETVLVIQDTLTTIIDQVSSGIKKLSIDVHSQSALIENKAVSYSGTLVPHNVNSGTTSNVLSVQGFCLACRTFSVPTPSAKAKGRFQPR